MTRTRRTLFYAAYLVVTVLILSELALRIYNPFHFRIKGSNIVLDTNKKYVISNSKNPALDKSIIHSKNSLGFRGAEPPKDYSRSLTIITVGGSTTECTYLTDGKTWTDHLSRKLSASMPQLWMNNGGVAGHSTFGHIALMKDLVINLHPDYVLFLVGVNDIRRNDLNESDKSNSSTHYKTFLTFLSKNSEVCNVIANLFRAREAKIRNLGDFYLDLKEKKDSLLIDDSTINKNLEKDDQFLPGYHERLKTLILLCQSNNVKPVLITQPCLPGKGFDPLTNTSLENFKVTSSVNGKLWWAMLEKYNEVTRNIAREYNVPLIDLAHLLPKTSLYFYDIIHFTNEGSMKAGSIIGDELLPILKKDPL
jgi:lysophospholipase L1-like esterase